MVVRTETVTSSCHVFIFLEFQSHMDRLKQLLALGIALLVLGIILHFSHGKIIVHKKD
jgi:hypothetical protein